MSLMSERAGAMIVILSIAPHSNLTDLPLTFRLNTIVTIRWPTNQEYHQDENHVQYEPSNHQEGRGEQVGEICNFEKRDVKSF